MTTQTRRKSANAPISIIGKDEMNLCELPIAKLGKRDRRDVIEFTGEVVKDGQKITQEWIVSGSARLGLPTEFAERVLVALISLAARNGFQTEKTPFTIYEILKLMNVCICGFHYREVVLALKRLHGVTISGTNTWWDNDKKRYRTIEKGFGLIDNYWLESQTDGDDEEAGTGGGGYVVWNKWLWKSFQAGYIKNLDTQFYYTLDHTLARRLYRFLDKRMHYQDTYQIDIFALAARLGMASYRYPSKVKEKLQPAFDELIERQYLVSAVVIKVGKFTRVKFVRNSARQAQQIPLWEDVSEYDAETASEGRSDVTTASGKVRSAESQESPLATLYAEYETPDALKQIWQEILQECSAVMQPTSYRMVADSALLEVQAEKAVIGIAARHKDWIERQMRRKFINQLGQHLNIEVREICFVDLASHEVMTDEKKKTG